MFLSCIGIALVLGTTAAQAESTTEALVHDGIERTYHTYTPENFNGMALMALHPTVSSGKAMEAMTDLNEAADEHGFMMVYPNSYTKSWNTGRDETGLQALEEPINDTGFILALHDHLIETHGVDSDRIFLTGHSSGGGLAYLLACNAADQFAGVAVVGTLLWNFQADGCPESDEPAPINLLVVHGNSDSRFPLEGQTWPNQQPDTPYVLRTLGIEQTMELYLDRSACAFDAIEGVEGVETVTFTDCADGVQLSLYVVPGAGHGWPRTGDYVLNQTGVDATELITSWMMGDADWAQPPGDSTISLPRSYRYYVPSTYDEAEAIPLVLVLHGRPDNGLGIAYITDMNPVAERESFVALYPDGIDFGWNYFYRYNVANVDETGAVNDTQFFRDLIADVSQDVNIDPNRVYVTGFSNGGFMTQLLACEAQDLFAAFAPVGSTLFPGLPGICRVEGAEPVPILFMHGTDDVSIPWTGSRQQGLDAYISFPVPQTLGFWATHNGCDLEAEWEELPTLGDSPGTKVIRNDFPNCAPGSELTLYIIDGGGHNWPGVPGVIGPLIAGRVNQDIHGSQVVWDFFKEHTKN